VHGANFAAEPDTIGHHKSQKEDQSYRALSKGPMDTLSPLFARFSLDARVFYSGSFCGNAEFGRQPGLGYLHVFREGHLVVAQLGAKPLTINEPSLIFYPRPCLHSFQVDDPEGAKLVCASIDFGAGVDNPLLSGFPNMLVIPLASMPGVEPMLALLFGEAFAEHPGRQAAIDRLAEYFVVLLLRFAIGANIVKGGVVAALADPRLSKVVTAMHERPEHAWSLEELAGVAGMSRARFAMHFRETTSTTPLDYLTEWRVSVAQTLLKRGKPLKIVAPMVGYESAAAFARVFKKRVGVSPNDWLNQAQS